LFLLHGFYYQLLEFRRIFFVWYSSWHNKTPHLLVSISYCLTYGVLFNVDLRYAFLFTKGPGLDGSTVKSICEKQLGDDRGSFLYQYRDKPEDVDLSVFKPWDQF
ncbi:MAG: hypothetical protein IJO10_06820, partial [Clostridia bacterium]|nr:hypothetical protein [Clostridia bacterium]